MRSRQSSETSFHIHLMPQKITILPKVAKVTLTNSDTSIYQRSALTNQRDFRERTHSPPTPRTRPATQHPAPARAPTSQISRAHTRSHKKILEFLFSPNRIEPPPKLFIHPSPSPPPPPENRPPTTNPGAGYQPLCVLSFRQIDNLPPSRRTFAFSLYLFSLPTAEINSK